MRVGENPEKNKNGINVLKRHRVIMVFYIADTGHGYFSELDEVLDKSLFSLINTINQETTAITLINNNSSKKVNSIIDKYKDAIDKYVIYKENKGKVYAVLNEVRGAFEEFVTITDADILFFDGWEKAVFDIFGSFPKAGVVSPYPCPYSTFHFNQSVFGTESLKGRISYEKKVLDYDIDLYLKGTNLPMIIDRKTKYNWRQKQFVLTNTNNDKEAVIGSYHVVSTYRTNQFHGIYSFPKYKFKNSYEDKYIDSLADQNGMYRLSTIKSYAYHIGNKVDVFTCEYGNQGAEKLEMAELEKIVPNRKNKFIFFNRIIGRIFIKFFWNK